MSARDLTPAGGAFGPAAHDVELTDDELEAVVGGVSRIPASPSTGGA